MKMNTSNTPHTEKGVPKTKIGGKSNLKQIQRPSQINFKTYMEKFKPHTQLLYSSSSV